MPDDRTPSLADIIAKTSGAQPRAKALASIEARRARLLTQASTGSRRDDAIGAPEPVPLIEKPDDYAAGFWERFTDKQAANKRPPPRGKKPRLVVDNDDAPDSPKKR